MFVSKTLAALEAANLERQSALVIVVNVAHCKVFANDPGFDVCPQPVTTALTPASMKMDPNGIALT